MFGDRLDAQGRSGNQQEKVRRDIVNKLLADSVEGAVKGEQESSTRQARDDLAKAGERLRKSELPFDYKKLDQVQSPQALGLLLKAAEHFDGATNKLDALGLAFDRNREKVAAATAAYGAAQSGVQRNELNSNTPPPLHMRAGDLPRGSEPAFPEDVRRGGDIERLRTGFYSAGGSIFQPRGTDVVPAMLTPGEFVVNARSAGKNSELLRLINGAQGSIPAMPPGPRDPGRPGYYAGGGNVGWGPDIANLKRLGDQFRGGAPTIPAPPGGDFGGGDFDTNPAELTEIARVKDVAKALAGADPLGELALARGGLGARGLLAARNAGNVGSYLNQQAALRGAFLPGEDLQAFGTAAGFESSRRVNDRAFGIGGRFGPAALARMQAAAPAPQLTRAQQAAIRAAQKNTKDSLSPLFRKPYVAPNYSKVEPTPAELAKVDLDKYKEQEREREFFKSRGDRLKKEYGVRGFALGGLVPGFGSQDSVPARLSPGEFVLNRQAVQSTGLANLNGANSGGAQTGSSAPNSDALTRALLDFGTKSDAVASAFRLFNTGADQLSKALDNFPRQVEHNGRFEVVVTHVGGEVFQALEPSVAQLVDRKVKAVLDSEFERRVPDAPRPLRS